MLLKSNAVMWIDKNKSLWTIQIEDANHIFSLDF